MVFFTRELYLGLQPGSGRERRSEREWNRRAGLYRRYADTVAGLLPQAVRRLDRHGLHDGVVREAWRTADELELLVDGTNAIGRFSGRHVRLTFRGVRGRPAVGRLVGQWWLYQEAHPRSDGRFCLQILLDPSEFEVEADELSIEVLPKSRGPR
jgi:hypothetical protein